MSKIENKELKEVLSTLDENIATDEFVSALETSFNEAVQAKVEEEVQKAISDKIDVEVAEKTALIKENLENEVLEEKEAFKAELTNDLTAYLENFVTDYVNENKEIFDNKIELLKAQAIVESFKSLGIEVKTISEDDRIQEREKELEEMKEKIDALMNEKIQLQDEVLSLSQGMVFEALSLDLTDTQKEKFEKLAESFVDEKDLSAFKEKLELIKESVLAPKDEEIKETKKIDEGDSKESKKEKRFNIDISNLI